MYSHKTKAVVIDGEYVHFYVFNGKCEGKVTVTVSLGSKAVQFPGSSPCFTLCASEVGATSTSMLS